MKAPSLKTTSQGPDTVALHVLCTHRPWASGSDTPHHVNLNVQVEICVNKLSKT